MVLLDLFPVGVMQLNAVLTNGLWFARSQTFQLSEAFQTLTWMRIVGGAIFVLGGVVPLTIFVCGQLRWQYGIAKTTPHTSVESLNPIERRFDCAEQPIGGVD